MIEILKEKCVNNNSSGKSVEIGYDINVSVVNVIWSLVSGERKSHDDARIREFLESVNKGIELSTTSSILLFFPFLLKIFPERMFKIDQMRKWMKNSYGYLQEVIDHHKKQDQNGDVKDFIEAFLIEMERDGAHASFNELQLLVLCSELFGAGGEPTSATLKWAIRYFAMNQEIQRKAQEEIDDILRDENRSVKMFDRSSLHNVQALIHDLIRLFDIHPIGVMHSPSEDIKIDDFVIPKAPSSSKTSITLITTPSIGKTRMTFALNTFSMLKVTSFPSVKVSSPSGSARGSGLDKTWPRWSSVAS